MNVDDNPAARAVLWDVDGTLVDSLEYHWLSWRAALEVKDCFDALVSAEEVERGKPDPQIFLTAAAKLQTPPARCIVVEDAPAGTEAARRAGMRAIGVLTTHARLEADRVARTLDELDDSAFDDLLDGGR